MTDEEGMQYFALNKVPISELDQRKFIKTIGAIPVALNALRAECLVGNKDVNGMALSSIVDTFILERITDAKNNISAFELTHLLLQLKQNPEGVLARDLNIREKGVLLSAPREVVPFMKKTNCIMYHMPTGTYRLVSKAHKTAIKEINIVPAN